MRTFLRTVLTVLVCTNFYMAAIAQQVAKTIPNATSPDRLIGFLEFRPSDYGSQRHPLIIFLHGIGERGNGTSQINSVANNAIPMLCSRGATMRFTVGGQTSSFVVLSPQLSTQYGYWPPYYVKEMIKYAKANLQIDPNRIYITGLSLGGGGVWRVATDSENFDYSFDAGIAAIAPVCGTQEENDANFCQTIGANHLPVWAFHAMDDGTVGVGATQHAEILSQQCGVTPAAKFTYYQSGGHFGAWDNAYDTGHITRTLSGGSSFTANPNIYEWFLSNSRSATPPPTYTAPIASAGAAQLITLPLNVVTLNGSGSGTGGATITSYSWTKTSGPANGSISLPGTPITLVTGLVQGTYVFTLTVTDNHGLTNQSSVTITVNAAAIANQAPTANAGSNTNITLPVNTVTLNGSASSDPDGSITGYQWTKISGPMSSLVANPGAAVTSLTNLVEGTYIYQLKVTDNAQATATANVTIVVNPQSGGTAAPPAPPPPSPAPPAVNKAPVASAGSDVTITLPTNSVALDGSASYDPDGNIVQYSWVKISGNMSGFIGSTIASVTSVTGLTEGTFIYRLEVKDNSGVSAYATKTIVVAPAGATTPPVVNPPVPPTPAPPPATEQPIGYIKISVGPYQACDDASSNGRTAIYASSIANGAIVYLDAAHTQVFDGGWNWYSFTSAQGGAVNYAFAVFPNGSINLLRACSAAPAPPPTPAPANNLLGYIKMSVGPSQACADASTSGRIAVYGTSISNGSYLYSDAAMTQKYDGGWNWFSFTPTLGGAVTQAFAIYPIGSIGLLTNCGSGARMMASDARQTTVPAVAATVTGVEPVATGKLSMYPNPVTTNATVQLSSTDNGVKTINLYNASGVNVARYNWSTVKGNNVYSLSNVGGLAKGLYIVDVRDAGGKTIGKLKFIKM